MKKLAKLRLNQLSKADLERREMNFLFGEGTPGSCSCGCSNNNTNANCQANTNAGYTNSAGMDDDYQNCCGCFNGNYTYNFNGHS